MYYNWDCHWGNRISYMTHFSDQGYSSASRYGPTRISSANHSRHIFLLSFSSPPPPLPAQQHLEGIQKTRSVSTCVHDARSPFLVNVDRRFFWPHSRSVRRLYARSPWLLHARLQDFFEKSALNSFVVSREERE